MADRRKGSGEDSELNPYEIWQEKQATIETAEIEKIERNQKDNGYPKYFNPVIYIRGFWSSLHDENRREATKVVISMFGIITTAFAAVGLIWTVWDSNENRKLNQKQFLEEKELTQQRLITDRFAKSASLLSDKDKAVRIAAIFALERIAKDSPQDHWTIMELLSAYVLEKSPLDEIDKVSKPNPVSKNSSSPEVEKESQKAQKPIANDVQAALTVIGRRDSKQDQAQILDLSSLNLSKADLFQADLNGAMLIGTDLRAANLLGANLNGAMLYIANLNGANLWSANLNGANLKDANLNGANLYGANLEGVRRTHDGALRRTNLNNAYLKNTNLNGANLKDADLKNADLDGANLYGAKNLTPSQIKSAKNWRNAKYDDAIRKMLGSPPEPSKDNSKATPDPSQSTPSPNSPDNIPVTSP